MDLELVHLTYWAFGEVVKMRGRKPAEKPSVDSKTNDEGECYEVWRMHWYT